MTSRDVERRLERLAAEIDWPRPTADLISRVGEQIQPIGQAPRFRVVWRRTAIAVAVGLVLLMSVLPPARQAVADLLGLAGIEISLTDQISDQLVSEFDFGESIPLDEATSEGGFVVRMPGREGLGSPDGVFLSDVGWINMVWIEADDLSAGVDGEPAVILSQFASGPSIEGLKSVSPDTKIEGVMVEGQPGRWIEGAVHSLTIVDADGLEMVESTRLAANVLLWEYRGVSYRLELAGDLDAATEIVHTLEPVGSDSG